MDISLLIMVGLVLILVALAFRSQGWAGVGGGLTQTMRMVRSVAPLLVLGFVAAGLIQVVVPPQLIARWMGEGSGLPGIFIGTAAGALTPAGPFVSFPLVASLFRSGAGVGPLSAYIVAWGVVPMHRTLIWELPLLGPSFTLPRYLLSLLFPIAAGLLAPYVFAVFARLIPTLR